MRSFYVALITVCLAFVAATTHAATYAIVGANVVPMDRERLIADQTVIVENGVIRAIGTTREIEIPEGATQIDGVGRYLMPGLSDMHVHVWEERDLELFVVNGVTTIRIMSGGPAYLRIRQRVATGAALGPRIYTAGPFVDGPEPTWPDSDVVADPAQGDAVVRDQQSRGYDFIKVYDGLSPQSYAAVVEAAHRSGLLVAGHVPKRVPLEAVLKLKQDSIEHLSGYGRALRSFDDHFQALSPGPVGPRDRERMRYLAVQTQAAGVWNCPTLVVFQKWRKDTAQFRNNRALRYVSAKMRAAWQPGNSPLDDYSERDLAAVRAGETARREMVAALHHAGAKLLLGTDTPNPWVIPGFAVYEELENLYAAGLSRYEALRTATVNAAEFLGRRKEAGTIAAGKIADLVLLDGNPLKDLSVVQRPLGVMLQGQWLSRERISGILDRRELDFDRAQ